MPTKIQWCEETWNPIAGCTKCSPGCLNCYAERMANRLKWMIHSPQYLGKTDLDGKWTGKVECCNWKLEEPLHWRKPRRIFVCSMSDLFHPKVEIGFLTHIFDTIEQCPQHTFIILTKRPKQALKMMWGKHGEGWRYFGKGDYHRNIHFGVSISNQAEADEKIPILLQIPAAVRWLSIEPMLGPIEFVSDRLFCDRDPEEDSPVACVPCRCGKHWQNGTVFGQRIGCLDWVVVGCESGPKKRPLSTVVVCDIVDQCKAADVPCFVKQITIDGKLVKMPKGFPQKYPLNS